MFRHLMKFTGLLLFVAGASYMLHAYIYRAMEPDPDFSLINFAYKFNFGITFIFTSTIILARKQLKEQLGFIFMAGSFVKLGVFMYLLKTGGFETGKEVFLHFFIPYALCVVLEILYVIRILNGTDFGASKENDEQERHDVS